MIEILCKSMEEDFKRLKIEVECTYSSNNCVYKVFKLDNLNFYKLCNDENEFKQTGTWLNVDNYGLGNWNSIVDINNTSCFCWLNEIDESEEYPSYKNILEYIEKALHVKSDWKTCQVLNDLAKLNNMSLSEFLKTYQG